MLEKNCMVPFFIPFFIQYSNLRRGLGIFIQYSNLRRGLGIFIPFWVPFWIGKLGGGGSLEHQFLFLFLTLKGFIKVSASFIFFFSPDGVYSILFYICISSQYPSVCLYFILLRYGPNQCVSVGVPT
jgi:hypothetical protein